MSAVRREDIVASASPEQSCYPAAVGDGSVCVNSWRSDRAGSRFEKEILHI